MKKINLLLGTIALGGVFTLASCGLDETDKLVDEAVNKYVTDYLIEDIKDDKVTNIHGDYSNFTNFWTYLVVGELKDNNYAISIKNHNPELYDYIKDYDLSTLSGVDFAKYYYYAKAFDINLDNFKVKYAQYLDTTLVSEYYEYGEYSLPFEIAPAKALKIQSDKITSLVNSSYSPSTEYGYDGCNWDYISDTLHGKTVDYDLLDTLSKATYDNPTSIALSIASFAASNVNIRDSKYKNENKDLVQKLLESYDTTLGLIKYDSTDTGINYSTNQIYASLIAYKYQRDTKTAVNIFK